MQYNTNLAATSHLNGRMFQAREEVAHEVINSVLKQLGQRALEG